MAKKQPLPKVSRWRSMLTKENLLIAALFLGALLIRTVDLTNLPQGFHVDEAKVGWEAYSILKTGADDWGHRFALHYDTIGDYRPTGIFYLSIPAIQLLGLSVFSVRLTGALFGFGCVVLVFFLTQLLTENRKAAICAAAITAFSPWEVVISRATSEVMMASFFMLLGLYFLVLSIKRKRILWVVTSAAAFIPGYLLYHTARVLTPIFIVATIGYFLWDTFRSYRKSMLIALGILVIGFGLLSGLFALNKEARARYDEVSIPDDPPVQQFIAEMPYEEGPNQVLLTRISDNKLLVYGIAFLNNYVSYINPSFLLSPEVAKPERYDTVNNGLITFVEFGLFIIGLWFVAKRKFSALPLILLLLAPLPAALTTEDSPNLSRALLMSPFLCIIAAYGFTTLLSIKKYTVLIGAAVVVLFTINFVYFWHMYATHNAVHSPMFLSRNIGALEMGQLLVKEQSKYDKIYVTDYPDEFYPWYAMAAKPNPAEFNKQVASRGPKPYDHKPFQWQNIVFTQVRCPSERFVDNPPGKVLAIDGEGCILPNFNNVKVVEVGRITRASGGSPYVLHAIDRANSPQ